MATSPAEDERKTEDAATPGAELATLQQRVSHLSGPARADALERICQLSLQLHQPEKARDAVHALSVEFPSSPQTGRAQALLARYEKVNSP